MGILRGFMILGCFATLAEVAEVAAIAPGTAPARWPCVLG